MEYLEIAKLYEKVNSTSKRLEKISILASFIKKIDDDDLNDLMLLLKGRVFHDWDRKDLGISSKLMVKVISISSGLTVNDVINHWKIKGDLGLTAMDVLSKSQQQTLFKTKLSVKDVLNGLRNISNLQGEGSSDIKIKLLSRLLSDAEGIEIKYLVRIVLEDLRTGANEGVIRDAIKLAFLSDNKEENISEILQDALDLTSDLSEIAISAKKGLNELKNIKPIIFKPLKLMLYPKSNNLGEIFKSFNDQIAFEYKYDGFRVQIHKKNDEIKIFTRRLDDVTEQFPDIVKTVKSNVLGDNFIIDCEVIGYDKLSGHYLPFQSISQRIKRKYNILEVSKKFPVEIMVFDIIYHNSINLIKKPFIERREYLSNIINEFPKKIRLSEFIKTDSIKKAEQFYANSLKNGFEGIMAKSLLSIYTPGRKVGSGFKLKPIMQELDLVITKAEWGNGKRSKWLTSFTISCIDDDNNFLEIGKVSSGLKELEKEGLTYSKITELALPLTLSEEGKEIILKPELILEINYEEIQTSQSYSSGFALRFPRIIRLREDKGLDEISDINQIDKLFSEQKGKK
jgi:DNA ligase 1